jgi:hypothetical protein
MISTSTLSSIKYYFEMIQAAKTLLNYLLISVTFAMSSHCLVIALLSACPINQRCTAPLFRVIPTKPPFILESLTKIIEKTKIAKTLVKGVKPWVSSRHFAFLPQEIKLTWLGDWTHSY